MSSDEYLIVLVSIWFVCGFISSTLLHTLYYIINKYHRNISRTNNSNSPRTIDNTNTNQTAFIDYVAEIEMDTTLDLPRGKSAYSYQNNDTNIIIITDPQD